MISFDNFKMQEGTPLYLQILIYIKRGVVAGVIGHGDELPSRRVLSALLGVNPNTVQKAYRMLEEEGLIHSYLGSKSCMVLDEDARGAVEKLRQMGLSKAEVFALIEKYWGEDGKIREAEK